MLSSDICACKKVHAHYLKFCDLEYGGEIGLTWNKHELTRIN